MRGFYRRGEVPSREGLNGIILSDYTIMALNIKNEEVEKLAAEVALATGETKTEAIRTALLQRKERLALPSIEARVEALQLWLESEVWSKLPPEIRGKGISQAEQDEILGYGPEGF